ncbi:MAG TPA: hypothetical protein VIC85_01220 [Ktedonobacterales bacterium]|jgi:hypothetical protein
MRSARRFSHRARHAWPDALALVVLSLALMLAGCQETGSLTGGSTQATSTPAAVAPTATATPAGYPVKVFFSKHPDSDGDVSKVFPVNRVSPTLGVATFAIQQLIAGPVAVEASAGYYTEITAALAGSSNCGGPDFKYTIADATHTGTLQFCRPTQLPGDLSGPRIKAEITATLTQFPNVTKVVILDSTGHCFDDASGLNACLH